MPIVEQGKRNGLFIIIYSDAGYCKTTLAAGLLLLIKEQTGKLGLYYDWDAGVGDMPAPDGKTPMVLFEPGEGKPELDAQDSVENVKRLGSPVYVVDTVTTFSQRLLMSCPPQATKSGSKSWPYNYSDAQAKFNQWAMQMFTLQRAGIHVVWFMHEGVATIEDADGQVKDVIGGPLTKLGDKFLRTIPAMSRLVYRIKVVPLSDGRVSRVLQTNTDGFYIAKDRLNAFPPGGVKIGVNPFEPDGKTAKPTDQFERECLATSKEVFATIFQAAERRANQKER